MSTESGSQPSRPPSKGIGLAGRCPKCCEGALFAGPLSLKLNANCPRCGFNLAFADPGDGPAIFAIFILGIVVLGGALVAEFKFGVPVWAHLVLWGVVTPILALVLLRWLKARLIAAQYKHSAGEGRLRHD